MNDHLKYLKTYFNHEAFKTERNEDLSDEKKKTEKKKYQDLAQ